MLNIFYQNKTLNDTLIINVSSLQANKIETKGDVTFGYNDKNLVFMNIRHPGIHFDNKCCVDGLIFPDKELLASIRGLTGIDLNIYFDNGFRVGKIESCEDIPGTHLHKCVVNVGLVKLNIICGAPNARTGLKVVVATDGTMLPSGKEIIAGQVLKFQSQGMLCSYKELGINKESKGIIELNDSYKIGEYFKEVYANCK
ncbi:MAG: hypothetical protein MJ233_01030 [Mycoplasmoidaceae bacterium]|nr:hypothetical protein [Mycoplasmoidaceae bacterium]